MPHPAVAVVEVDLTRPLHAGQKVEIFDLGGSKNIRRIWKTYLSEVHGVIYVVDASDQTRFEESSKALEEALGQAHLHDKPILVFANKQVCSCA